MKKWLYYLITFLIVVFGLTGVVIGCLLNRRIELAIGLLIIISWYFITYEFIEKEIK